ncbi:MAG: hypothetical protein IPG64_11650 [Haliea sp.]|nr:hypothetical protein [Haliea sp.]
MLTKGVLSLDMRYRYEYVDEDGFDDEANASTLRSKVAFQSARYEGFSFLGELSNVSYIGADDFNSTENGKKQYPVVADPDGTELNQAWARYDWKELSGIYGRQRINYSTTNDSSAMSRGGRMNKPLTAFAPAGFPTPACRWITRTYTK